MKLETNLKLISQLIPDLVLVIRSDGTILHINTKPFRKYGFKEQDLLGKNILELDFIPPDTKKVFGKNLARRLQAKKVAPYEVKLYTKSGEERYFEVNGSLAEYRDETVDVALLRDITERKRAEEALRESGERYRSRLDNLMEGCQIIDFDWRYVYVNEAAARQGRTTRENLLGHTMMEVYPGIEQTEMFVVLKICMERRQPADIETEFQFPDGEKGWFDLRVQPVKEGILILSIDVTERKRLEGLSTTLVSSSQIGVYVVQDRKFQFVNPQFLKYMGFSQDELVGTNPLSLVHREDRERVRENAVKMLKGEPSSAYEYRALTKDGETKWIRETVTPIIYKRKRATLGSFLDITERKQMEERLLRLYGILLLIRRVNQLIVEVDNELELLQGVCNILSEVHDYRFAWIGLVATESEEILPVAQAGFEQGFLQPIKISKEVPENGEQPAALVIRTRQPYVSRDILNDPRYQSLRRQAQQLGYASLAALPLVVEDKVIGALNVYSGRPDAYDDTELHMLVELAGDISLGITKIRGRSELTKVERALYQSEQMLRLMFESMSDGLMVTDLNGVITELNQRTLQMHGFDSKKELLGTGVFELIARHDRDRAKANLQQTLEQGLVRDIEYTLIKKDSSEFPGELSTSLLKDASGKAIGFITVTRDITERKKSEEQLKEAYEAIVISMILNLEARDPYTRGHSDKVRLYCRRIARQMGLPSEQVHKLERAASLHDIGKIAVPDAILTKPGGLTTPEFAQIQLHPEKSVDLLRMIPNPKDTLSAIRHHHERVNGKGYPHGLSGDDIPLCARIMAVADAYDALTSARSYRQSLSHEEALKVLKDGAGTQWDAKVVEAAIKALG